MQCLGKMDHFFLFFFQLRSSWASYMIYHCIKLFIVSFSAWLTSCVFADETLKLLKELTSKKSLQVPNIYYHLPHLLKNEGSLQPSVQVGLGRTGGKLIQCLFYVFYLEEFLVLVIQHTVLLSRSRTSHLTCVILLSLRIHTESRMKGVWLQLCSFLHNLGHAPPHVKRHLVWVNFCNWVKENKAQKCYSFWTANGHTPWAFSDLCDNYV